MSRKFQASLYESVYLAMNGVLAHYADGAAMDESKRSKLVEIVRDIKARERAEMVQAIMKGAGA
jgi:hypothetical protein